jgi:hypothetical protein
LFNREYPFFTKYVLAAVVKIRKLIPAKKQRTSDPVPYCVICIHIPINMPRQVNDHPVLDTGNVWYFMHLLF